MGICPINGLIYWRSDMKVYVIQKGVYSSRFIVGVVTSEEEAKQICEVISDNHYGGEAFYDEFETDDLKTNLIKFKVDNSYGDWEVEYCSPYEWEGYNCSGAVYENYYIIFAHKKKEAIKRAQDMKAAEQAIKKNMILF